MPSKTVYNVGDSFSQSGLTLTATYSDGSSKTISSGFTCSGFNSSSAGTKTITVTYQGKTTTFTVTVKSAAATLTGIAIKAAPSKTVYTYRRDKNLDITGLEVEATYSDGSKTPIDPAACTISGYSAKPAGNKTITVAYEGQTAQFTVTVQYLWWQRIIRIVLLGFLWY
ncbi:MAG: bacterial Ig-like domain-containing protein [Clostridia bacterium]|nr:bacterial Ig-like domain-containing protein [Clostridia bacterium]